MRTLANGGRLGKDAPFTSVRGHHGKVFSFYLYLWSRVVWGGSEQGCGPGNLSSGPSSCPYSPKCLEGVFPGIATWIHAGKRYPGEPS